MNIPAGTYRAIYFFDGKRAVMASKIIVVDPAPSINLASGNACVCVVVCVSILCRIRVVGWMVVMMVVVALTFT